jgi:hypothetical protein
MNNLEFATILQKGLDEQMTASAASGWMEQNAGQLIYNGGAEVKIPVMSLDGLGDYDRATGFVDGAVTLTHQTKTLTQDRGRSFMIDAMDVDETNFIVTATTVIGQFQKLRIVPEVDAYRFSKIAEYAIDGGRAATYTPAENSILDRLNDDLYAIWDTIGEDVSLVICMSSAVSRILDNSDKLQRKLDVTQFTSGAVSTKVRSYNDVPILRVPSKRMCTKYDFQTGGTGQTGGGFKVADDAEAINWIVTARTAPIAVSKTDTVRIFDPSTNQKAHAWKIDFRKYHDLWIPENKLAAVRVNKGPLA